MQLNESTLGGFPLYNAPKDYGRPVNILQWRTGAARFGIGVFLMEQADYFSLVSGNGFNGKTTLFLQGGPDKVNNKLQQTVRVCGFQVAKAGIGTTDNMVEVMVQDLRADDVTPLQKAYNVPQQPFAWASSDYNYWNSTLNSSAAWSWVDALNDADLPVLPSTSIPSWKPRNLIFDNIPFCRAVDEVAARLFIIPGFDGNETDYYTPGEWDPANTTLFNQATTLALIAGDKGNREDTKNPTSIDVCFAANGQDPFTQRFYIKNVTVGDGDNKGPKQALHLGDIPAISSGSSTWANQSDMDTIAADMAARFYKWLTVVPSEYTFAGIWPFVLDGAIRYIEWISGEKGATTRIVLNNERFFSPLDDFYHSVVLPTNQLVLPLGQSFVSTHGGSGSKFFLGGAAQTLVRVLATTWTDSTVLAQSVYRARVVTPNGATFNPTVAPTDSSLFTAGTTDILVVNEIEIGLTKRLIDPAGNVLTFMAVPMFTVSAAGTFQGVPVYYIPAFQPKVCSNGA